MKDGVSIERRARISIVAWRELAQAYPDVEWRLVRTGRAAPPTGRRAGTRGDAVAARQRRRRAADRLRERGQPDARAWCARQRELALRAALGARRARLLQQVMVEGLVLSSVGATPGLLFARWATPLLVALAPREDAAAVRSDDGLDGRAVHDGRRGRVRRWRVEPRARPRRIARVGAERPRRRRTRRRRTAGAGCAGAGGGRSGPGRRAHDRRRTARRAVSWPCSASIPVSAPITC